MKLMAGCAAALLVSGTAFAQTQVSASASPANIDMSSGAKLREYISDLRGDGIYFRDRQNNWYYGRFDSRCAMLPYSDRVGLKDDGRTRIEAGSTMLVLASSTTRECTLADLRVSTAPSDSLRRWPRAAADGSFGKNRPSPGLSADRQASPRPGSIRLMR